MGLGTATVLVNDDQTRSFLTLLVEKGEKEVHRAIKCVDDCMKLHNLQCYYEVS